MVFLLSNIWLLWLPQKVIHPYIQVYIGLGHRNRLAVNGANLR